MELWQIITATIIGTLLFAALMVKISTWILRDIDAAKFCSRYGNYSPECAVRECRLCERCRKERGY